MLERIERQAGSFSKAERRVAGWVLEHPRQTAEGSVAALAQAAGTSDPTVIRFCRRLGLSGFREFKLRLAAALNQAGSYVHSDVGPDDSTTDVVQKVLDRSIRALAEARKGLTALPLEQAVAAMSQARQLVFCGVGASGHVARDAEHKFFRLGMPCTVATDLATMLQLAAIAQPGDVFVMISQTGSTEGTVAAACAARRQGATSIAITAAGSPLAQNAAVLIDCQPSEDTSMVTPMSSRLAMLAVLDALQVLLAMRLGDVALERLRRSKQALDTLRES